MKDIVNDISVYFGEPPIDDEKRSILENQKPADVSFRRDYL
jgi:hypothetical protein